MIGKILKFFVGDKSKKDLKLINPIIDKIHSFHQEVSNYSNDELRAETINFKTKIHDSTLNLHYEIDKIKSESLAILLSVTFTRLNILHLFFLKNLKQCELLRLNEACQF